MSYPIISAKSVSKSFVIKHQTSLKHNTLRDLFSDRIRKLTHRNSVESTMTKSDTEEFWALRDVDFDLYPGDRLGIIGRNGAGKSTLLKILSRITEPTKGTIHVRGRIASLLEVGTGFHPELTGRENVFLNGAILGMGRSEIKSKFDEIVEFAEVSKFLDTPVKRYSSGMYVRLAFAVAAHLEPEILVVDEVLAVGDAQFQKKCLGKMQDVSNNEGRTVLFVSHNIGVVTQLCQKALYLKGGQVEGFGNVKEVVSQYLFSGQAGELGYFASDKSRPTFIESIETVDLNGSYKDGFNFDENVLLKVKTQFGEMDSSTKMSFTFQNQNGDYLSTIVMDASEVRAIQNNNNGFLHIKFQANLLAPNSYAFRVAVFNPNGKVHDLVDMVCPIQIYDSGTDMALFEGTNYGSFFIDYSIHEI